MAELTLRERHERCLYLAVRVRADKALGSGTILHVEPDTEGEIYDWYVLTNEHVVDGLISVEKRWNSLLRKEVKTDILGSATIEAFTYAYMSRTVGASSYQAEIAAYDKDEDLALLVAHVPHPYEYVARLIPREEGRRLLAFEDVWNVGCGLGEKPVVTGGFLSGFGYEIERKDYMQVTAPSIFGNSGGATFLARTGEMIGVPARISVNQLGFSADAITHMGFSITAERIYKFLGEQVYDFVYGSGRSAQECAEERERRREADLRRRAEHDEDEE